MWQLSAWHHEAKKDENHFRFGVWWRSPPRHVPASTTPAYVQIRSLFVITQKIFLNLFANHEKIEFASFDVAVLDSDFRCEGLDNTSTFDQPYTYQSLLVLCSNSPESHHHQSTSSSSSSSSYVRYRWWLFQSSRTIHECESTVYWRNEWRATGRIVCCLRLLLVSFCCIPFCSAWRYVILFGLYLVHQM